MRVIGCVVALLLVVAPVSAVTIAGTVYEDRPALALQAHFAPLSGVTVKLYSDAGAALATKHTNAMGHYSFTVDAPGDYWVAVDSRSIRAGAWPDQTFGPTGAQCVQIDETVRTNQISGPCFGGRTATTSDDASTLAASRHVAHVSATSSVYDNDFAFSFDVVTTTADSPSDDQPVQGSLRQFIVNANAISGANAMRFVPLQRAPESQPPGIPLGVPPSWWTVKLTRPLPELRGDDTTIDGTAYNYLSAASPSDVNPGRIGESAIVEPGETGTEQRQPKPELEIIALGDEGIACAGRCALRAFATYGARVSIVTRSDAKIRDVIIGSLPDANPSGVTGEVGVQIERGTTTIRALYATDQTTAGVAIATTEARLDGERLQVSRCGTLAGGAGVALIADGSVLRSSWISANAGVGVLIGSPDGKPARNNTIETSTISSNLAGIIISPGAANNLVTHSAIMWNRSGGVIAAGTEASIPRQNRITANWYNENGGRPISIYRNGVPNMLAAGAASCGENATEGVAPPVVNDVHLVEVKGGKERVIIRGRTCPNHTVEIYQSFVTTEVREKKKSDLPMIRKSKDVEPGETVAIQDTTEDNMAPSIGEFNYVGTTKADADGTFEASFPFARTNTQRRDRPSTIEFEIWGRDVLETAGIEVTGRAFSAVSIDAVGNTSEVSARRRIN